MDIFYSFLITSLAGLATMLGTFVIFFSSKNKDKIITSSLSFASGVMVCVSLLDLMPESLNMLNNNLNLFLGIILFLIFLCKLLFYILLSRSIHVLHFPQYDLYLFLRCSRHSVLR